RANRILGWDELGPRQSDVDGDGHIDFSDVLLVLNRWGTQNWLCDLDSDGTVGFSDILQVLLDWES
ncbi:MAG: dockerin type I domain-containing protein, partial [Planctomycetota bacterium]